jgi:ribosomal protein RSM22 (predicted rRNA methylase)
VATKTELTKEEKIKKEITRLKGVFRDLDKNKLKTVESLICNAAFMSVSLIELQETINEEGYTEEYKNGANQYGVKQSEAVRTHISMTKNHAAIMKQLTDLAPPARKQRSALQALRDET